MPKWCAGGCSDRVVLSYFPEKTDHHETALIDSTFIFQSFTLIIKNMLHPVVYLPVEEILNNV